MTTSQVIGFFGSRLKAANALGISSESIRKWLVNGRIPYGRQCEIEILTKGALKAEAKTSTGAAA